MKIHREGYPTLILISAILISLNFVLFFFVFNGVFFRLICLFVSISIFTFFLQFFRFPKRISNSASNEILCPADGEVVVIEETMEEEYFHDKRLQISIFMSPLNVHINWYPVSGLVKYSKYHPGKFLVAWHPKSSTLNERSTVVVQTNEGKEVLVRQIAGAVARRIVTYSEQGGMAEKNQQLGFIKFGSRVDILLPIGTNVQVKLNEMVKGNETILAKFE